MAETRLASRYAKSLIQLAIEQGTLEKVCKDMKALRDTCEDNKELVLLLKSPVITIAKKKSILNELFANSFSEISNKFIDIIVSKKREMHLLRIATEFLNQYNEHKNILRAVVISVSGIDDAIREKVTSLIKNEMNSEVELIEQIDADLIGGFVLRVGDKQIDASLKRKLKSLSRNFSDNPYVKDF